MSIIKPLKGLLLASLVAAATVYHAITPAEATITLSQPEITSVPAIPDAKGRAGMPAGVVTTDGQKCVMAVGGANFPDALPWEGGVKAYYSDIFLLKDNKWGKIGDMPTPVGYSAFTAVPQGLVIAGGSTASAEPNKDAYSADVWLVRPDGATIALPPLPQPVAFPAVAVMNKRLYVMGGQNDTGLLKTIYVLNLSAIKVKEGKKNDAGEKTEKDTLDTSNKLDVLAWTIEEEIPIELGVKHAFGGASDGKVYLLGGQSANEGGDPIGLQSVWIFYPSATGKGAEQNPMPKWTTRPGLQLPHTLSAGAVPAPAREGCILLIGGDPRASFKDTSQTHKAQSNEVLVFNPLLLPLDKEKEIDSTALLKKAEVALPAGVATLSSVVMDHHILLISGETSPGVRTPDVITLPVGYHLNLLPMDFLVLILTIIAIGLVLYQTRKYGLKGAVAKLTKTDDKKGPGYYAWLCVGLLWVVAMLNYFDRQLLTTIREPIVRDAPQTEADFALLTTVFLFIYAGLSPVGGFLADRYSRRLIILISLVVWSVVTWMTGHVSNYQELFVARALMGISEACYIPAALALITDFHRGKTRSLATGLHMSGVYAGMAFTSAGAFLAENEGWRFTFGLCGLVGVVYALVLILFLKDPAMAAEKEQASEQSAAEDATEQTEAADATVLEKPTFGYAVRSLFGNKAFRLLLVVMMGTSIANWLLLTWLPTVCQEKFNLSLSSAGFHATFWLTMCKFIAVIGGAIIADRWVQKNRKGRQLLPGIAFVIATPFIFLSSLVPSGEIFGLQGLYVFIALLCSQGLAQGIMDATLMPVLRSHIDERLSATGYGCLNFIGAGMGGVFVYVAGYFRDAGVNMTTMIAFSAPFFLMCGVCLFLLPKPSNK